MQCPRHPPPPYRHHHLRHESPSPFFTLSLSSHHQPHILRTHNSHSSSLLSSPLQTPPNDAVLPHQHIPALLEPSQPFPRFPGSVHVEPPFILEEKGYDDDGVVLRAVEIKRRVTREILINELSKKGKFGITYATNLCASCGGFVDLVMIEAAAMKKLNEFCGSSFNDRVRWFIEESGVVPLVRWFKHNSLSYLQIGRLINMSRGDLERVRLLAEWLKSIHVNGRFIGVVFVRVGESILGRAMEELDEIIVYLESNGVRKDWMGYVISRCPEVLAFSMDEVRTRVRFYMDMGMNEHDFGTMVFDCPKVLGYFSLEEMKQQVNYIKEFGLSDEDVGRLLAFKPQLMVCSIEERWKPLIKYLYYLGIGRDGLRRVLVIKPMVFCVDLETTIAPKVRFLQDLGIKEDAIGRMLVKFPPLLTYSLYKKIRPVVVFLLTKAGVTEKNIAKVIALAPELLGCSIAHKLDGNVKYFLSLGISLRQLGKMIADFPMLLRYNVELLRPKYRYLRRTMVRPLQDLIEFPRFFSYSLEERIIPRHKVMVENRVNFELRYMLASTDAEFNQRVRDTVEQRQRFDSGILSEVYLSDSITTSKSSHDGKETGSTSHCEECQSMMLDLC